MGGHDPYSSSKGAAELVTAAYARSFFETGASKCSVASVRAGNVIGGGDWAKDRLMADLMRGLIAGEPIVIRQPRAMRPWQHVLDPLAGYLSVAEKVWSTSPAKWEGWNFGPDPGSERTVQEVATLSCRLWGRTDLLRINEDPNAPHEAAMLKLDSAKARAQLGWAPRWDIRGSRGAYYRMVPALYGGRCYASFHAPTDCRLSGCDRSCGSLQGNRKSRSCVIRSNRSHPARTAERRWRSATRSSTL